MLLSYFSNAIEHMKGPGSGTIYSSFTDAGGLIFGLFLFYVTSFGVAWYCGYQKRDQLRREAVEKQIAKERALNALQNIEWSCQNLSLFFNFYCIFFNTSHKMLQQHKNLQNTMIQNHSSIFLN